MCIYHKELYPLVWNKRTGHLVGGHQRFKILLEKGFKEVECSVVDLDHVREKALNIALNKISGSWDDELLAVLLEELKAEDIVTLTGFDFKEVEQLIGDIPTADFAPIPEREQPRLDEKNKVVCPDCGCEFTP